MHTAEPHSAPRRASTPHAFTPDAILARAHAADQAARALQSAQLAPIEPADALAALAAGIDAAEAAASRSTGAAALPGGLLHRGANLPEPFQRLAVAIDGGRA